MSAPDTVRWAVEGLVRERGPAEAARHMADRMGADEAEATLSDMVADDNDEAKAALSALRQLDQEGSA